MRLNDFGDLGQRYVTALASLVPGGRVDMHPNPFLVTVRQGKGFASAATMLAARSEWLQLLQTTLNEMQTKANMSRGEA